MLKAKKKSEKQKKTERILEKRGSRLLLRYLPEKEPFHLQYKRFLPFFPGKAISLFSGNPIF